MLKMPKEPFDRVLKDLVEYGVLEENDNMYGANHYNITLKYIEIKHNKKRQNVLLIAEFIGSFCGTAYSTISNAV